MASPFPHSFPLPSVTNNAIHQNGQTILPSSFGPQQTTLGPPINPNALYAGRRPVELSFRESFYRCTHHDAKMFDAQGRMISPGSVTLLIGQPFIGGMLPTQYVPLEQRRPDDPRRLATVIVNRFTDMSVGKSPAIACIDPDTLDFAMALAEEFKLDAVLQEIRTIGGSTGSVGLSWAFVDGKPSVTVHRPQTIHVLEWENNRASIPAHVVELYQTDRTVFDEKAGKYVPMRFWVRRDWTKSATIAFVDQPISKEGGEPVWVVDEEATYRHGEGRCHFVWIRNKPPPDSGSADGICDFDGLFENLMTHDATASVTSSGGRKNLDPTLCIKGDPDVIARTGIRKGSDNAIILDKDNGDAKYLELGGQSIQLGMALTDNQQRHILTVANCVIPAPEQVLAAGTSSLALRMLYAPMLNVSNVLRGQYGAGIKQLLEQMLASARLLYGRADEVELIEGDDGETYESPVEYFLDLPPREVSEEELDADGNPTGERITTFEERHPGEGESIQIVWPAYFEPTVQEKSQELSMLSLSAGGKPVISHRTAIERASALLGSDPLVEYRQILEETRKASLLAEEGMFLPTGIPDTTSTEEASDLDTQDAGHGEPTAEARVAAEAEVLPQQVLNGAQIQSAIAIVEMVAERRMPREAALGQLEVFFNIPKALAEKILGPVGLDFFAPTKTDETQNGG